MNCDAFLPRVRQFGFRFITSGRLAYRDRVDVTFGLQSTGICLSGWP